MTVKLGDGNCLFRALTFILYGSETVHEKMRQLLVQFMQLNRGPYIESDIDIDTYLVRMRHNRVWGTAELLDAASLLQIPLFTFIQTPL